MPVTADRSMEEIEQGCRWHCAVVKHLIPPPQKVLALLATTLLLMVDLLPAATNLSFPSVDAEPLSNLPADAFVLHDGWEIRESAITGMDGARISSPEFKTTSWYSTTVPTTALAALVRHGVYPDPYIGLNNMKIPDACDAFNRRYDLEKFSHLPNQAALTHLPAPQKLDAKPAPEGEVLEITATVTDDASPNERLVVPFASFDGAVYATDYIEYDVMIAPGGLKSGFFYSPFKSKDKEKPTLDFVRGIGLDQFGREQVLGPAPQGGPGVWEHRVIGLESYAPTAFGRQGMVFRGNHPGTFKVYLDNLQILHTDGTTTPIWLGQKDTRTQAIQDTKSFQGVHVRSVPLASIK